MPYKKCTKCNKDCGVRARTCQYCNQTFSISINTLKKRKNGITTSHIEDWKELVKGDVVDASGGPFYINEKKIKTRVGWKGRFKVVSKDKNGLLCIGIGKGKTGLKQRGFTFLYMGPKKHNKDTGIYRCPYRLQKVNNAKI